MPRSNCPSIDELAAYFAGRLMDEPFAIVAEHVEYCIDCQERLDRISETDRSRAGSVEQFTAEPECERAVHLIAGIPRTLDEHVPSQVGQYKIVKRIGIGGMGSVFQAVQRKRPS